MKTSIAAPHRVVIVGGGFGGLNAARALARAPVGVVVVDRRNHHLFQPLLYQVATGALSPADIASPLRHVLSLQRNARVILGEMTGLEPEARRVVLADGTVEYDTLIVAAGSKPFYFGHDGWAEHAPGLKDLEDATRMRARILGAFERAELEQDPARRAVRMNFVIVGGGPTGVELAGAVAELARDTLRNDFRSIDPRLARVILLEGADRLLLAYPPWLAERAVRSLERLGVEVWTGALVSEIDGSRIRIRRAGIEQELEAMTVLWAAGVRASELGAVLAARAGAALDRQGRVHVDERLALPGHPEILVVGDLAHREQDGEVLPGVAPVAMQQGSYAGRLVRARLQGRAAPPFRYRDKGSMAVIGRSAAVAFVAGRGFSGFPAWLLWLFVHLMYLVGFENRVLVLFQWAWNHLTRNRTARLITEVERPLP